MKIHIEKHNPNWKNDFLNLKKKIETTLFDFSPAIEHIGSTSVPDLAAKPVIDILVGLQSESDLDEIVEPMMNARFVYFKKYEPSWPERRLFVVMKSLTGKPFPKIFDIGDEYNRGEEFTTSVHVHIIEKGAGDWDRHLAFRDYLTAFPEIKKEYETLKLGLSKIEMKSHLEYNAGKNDWIKQKEREALKWRNNN